MPAVITGVILPDRVNDLRDKVHFQKHENGRITLKMYFCNFRSLLCLLKIIFAFILLLFFNGQLSDHLTEPPYNLSTYDATYFNGIAFLTFAIALPFIGILTRCIHLRLMALIGFALGGVGALFLGPSALFSFA